MLTLTSDDIKEDPAWAFATIAVTGNNERLSITKAQAERFGWVRNEPVLQWVCPVRLKKAERRSGKAKPKISYTYTDLSIDPSLVKGKFSLTWLLRSACFLKTCALPLVMQKERKGY